MTNDNYLNLVTSLYRNKEKFITWLTAGLDIVDKNTNLVDSLTIGFDIDTAVGKQLDILGDILGQSRTVNFQPTDGSSSTLTDGYYRTLLKAKVIINLWDGQIPSLKTMWSNLFDGDIIIRDNQDMTMDIAILGEVPLMVRDLVKYGYIIPKPQSVGINYYFFGMGPMFGYDIENDFIKGYDEGLWAVSENQTLFGYDQDDLSVSGYDAGSW